jgi:hypothetical protein
MTSESTIGGLSWAAARENPIPIATKARHTKLFRMTLIRSVSAQIGKAGFQFLISSPGHHTAQFEYQAQRKQSDFLHVLGSLDRYDSYDL